MTREEIMNRKTEIHNELVNLYNEELSSATSSKARTRRIDELTKEYSNLQRELDKLDGKTYNSDKWITKYYAESYVSLKDARFKLIELIKNLPGVEVNTDTKTGVAGVAVYTEYKIYFYTIHGHYWNEEVPGTRRVVKGMFGDDYETCDYRVVYGASIDTNGSHWVWRY